MEKYDFQTQCLPMGLKCTCYLLLWFEKKNWILYFAFDQKHMKSVLFL
jgi:hypothetical protein